MTLLDKTNYAFKEQRLIEVVKTSKEGHCHSWSSVLLKKSDKGCLLIAVGCPTSIFVSHSIVYIRSVIRTRNKDS